MDFQLWLPNKLCLWLSPSGSWCKRPSSNLLVTCGQDREPCKTQWQNPTLFWFAWRQRGSTCCFLTAVASAWERWQRINSLLGVSRGRLLGSPRRTDRGTQLWAFLLQVCVAGGRWAGWAQHLVARSLQHLVELKERSPAFFSLLLVIFKHFSHWRFHLETDQLEAKVRPAADSVPF